MGLAEDIVKKLKEKSIEGWNDLTIHTLKQLKELGLTAEEITQISDATGRHMQIIREAD